MWMWQILSIHPKSKIKGKRCYSFILLDSQHFLPPSSPPAAAEYPPALSVYQDLSLALPENLPEAPRVRSPGSLCSRNSLSLLAFQFFSPLPPIRPPLKKIKKIWLLLCISTFRYFWILTLDMYLHSRSSSVTFIILAHCSGSVMFNSFRWDSFRPPKSSKFWKPCIDRRDPSS